MSGESSAKGLERIGLTKFGQLVGALLVLGAGVGIAAILFSMKQQPPKQEARLVIPDVEVVTAAREDVTVEIPSQGILEPAQETTLAGEVTGKVLWVSTKFESGLEFAQDEELVRLDDADYKSALALAKAAHAEAKMALEVEQARVDQAIRDWNKLAAGQKPESDLATRQPQLNAARTRAESAASAVEKADRDLKRTVIRGPYRGRIRRTRTEVGSFLIPGAPVAEVYGVETFEVRLPIPVDDYPLLDFSAGPPVVKLSGRAGDQVRNYDARIVRTEGEVDRHNRSVHVVAEIKPGEKADSLLAPGFFLRAGIRGKTLANVSRLPKICLHGRDKVWVLDGKNCLHSRTVSVVRSQEKDVLVGTGLEPCDKVQATVLQIINEGMEVRPVQPAPAAGGAPVQ
jgi:RND family efflux transporter MFP subunit